MNRGWGAWEKEKLSFNPFQSSVAFHIETSHLICIANQMTGVYMECSTGLKRVNKQNKIQKIKPLSQWKLQQNLSFWSLLTVSWTEPSVA